MIQIKKIQDIADYRKIPGIQKSAWEFKDIDVEPLFLMTRIQKYGGLVQGLFLDDNLIGFTYAVIGDCQREYFIYSHMTAVMKEYQGKGYGFLLKQAQREEILKMGYKIIRWNFDPLESLNAYFNIHRLGVICQEYERNIYGEGQSGIHKGLATDRLIATWNLESTRVVSKMKARQPRSIEDIPKKGVGNFTGDVTYIEIPGDIRDLKKNDLSRAIDWQMKMRDLLEQALDKGYTVQDIVFQKDSQKIYYKLRAS